MTVPARVIVWKRTGVQSTAPGRLGLHSSALSLMSLALAVCLSQSSCCGCQHVWAAKEALSKRHLHPRAPARQAGKAGRHGTSTASWAEHGAKRGASAGIWRGITCPRACHVMRMRMMVDCLPISTLRYPTLPYAALRYPAPAVTVTAWIAPPASSSHPPAQECRCRACAVPHSVARCKLSCQRDLAQLWRCMACGVAWHVACLSSWRLRSCQSGMSLRFLPPRGMRPAGRCSCGSSPAIQRRKKARHEFTPCSRDYRKYNPCSRS